MYVHHSDLMFEGAMLMTMYYMYMCTLYPPCTLNLCTFDLQGGDTPLHLAAMGGHTTCVEHLLFTPGIDVNIKSMVSLLHHHHEIYRVFLSRKTVYKLTTSN